MRYSIYEQPDGTWDMQCDDNKWEETDYPSLNAAKRSAESLIRHSGENGSIHWHYKTGRLGGKDIWVE